jgi:hypothetical protein
MTSPILPRIAGLRVSTICCAEAGDSNKDAQGGDLLNNCLLVAMRRAHRPPLFVMAGRR